MTHGNNELMSRNLVSALLHHETIKTTLPKAKEAARMAEKVCPAGLIIVGS
jgi:large subunit ribosomal protein L17